MIEIETDEKIRITKSGANKLFRVDYAERNNMTSEQLIELFDQVWSRSLEQLVLTAGVIEYGEVNRRLLDKYHIFIDPKQEHRSFHYQKAEFIAQLQPFGNGQYKLTQLWRVASSDTYPKTVFINFSSVEERDRFDCLAQQLGWTDEELGLHLIRNFMNLHPGFEALQA